MWTAEANLPVLVLCCPPRTYHYSDCFYLQFQPSAYCYIQILYFNHFHTPIKDILSFFTRNILLIRINFLSWWCFSTIYGQLHSICPTPDQLFMFFNGISKSKVTLLFSVSSAYYNTSFYYCIKILL